MDRHSIATDDRVHAAPREDIRRDEEMPPHPKASKRMGRHSIIGESVDQACRPMGKGIRLARAWLPICQRRWPPRVRVVGDPQDATSRLWCVRPAPALTVELWQPGSQGLKHLVAHSPHLIRRAASHRAKGRARRMKADGPLALPQLVHHLSRNGDCSTSPGAVTDQSINVAVHDLERTAPRGAHRIRYMRPVGIGIERTNADQVRTRLA
jgi:hypothetical protein